MCLLRVSYQEVYDVGICLIFGGVNFDYFIKVIFARLICEVTVFPFVKK